MKSGRGGRGGRQKTQFQDPHFPFGHHEKFFLYLIEVSKSFPKKS